VGYREYQNSYNFFYGKLDLMIDGSGNKVDEVLNGIKIMPKEILEQISCEGKYVCFIIFPNLEEEIISQIEEYVEEFDTVVFRLIDFDLHYKMRSYSENGEDILIMDILEKIGVDNPYYVDIGVCHPVIRNNTYMFYERGYKEGLLIEPNCDMCKLIKEYRSENIVANVGACGEAMVQKSMKYYMPINKSYRGHNTILYDIAKKGGFEDNYAEIPVININELLKEYCNQSPDFIDIDTEGMDYEILRALDLKRYHAKVICVERGVR